MVAVGPGFLQVAPPAQADRRRDRVLVLVDQAMAAGGVDRAAAQKDLAAADKSWPRGTASSTAPTRRWSSAAAGPRPASTPPTAPPPTIAFLFPSPREAGRGPGVGARGKVTATRVS